MPQCLFLLAAGKVCADFIEHGWKKHLCRNCMMHRDLHNLQNVSSAPAGASSPAPNTAAAPAARNPSPARPAGSPSQPPVISSKIQAIHTVHTAHLNSIGYATVPGKSGKAPPPLPAKSKPS